MCLGILGDCVDRIGSDGNAQRPGTSEMPCTCSTFVDSLGLCRIVHIGNPGLDFGVQPGSSCRARPPMLWSRKRLLLHPRQSWRRSAGGGGGGVSPCVFDYLEGDPGQNQSFVVSLAQVWKPAANAPVWQKAIEFLSSRRRLLCVGNDSAFGCCLSVIKKIAMN